MTSCTIIISHYESLSFLRACVRQIRKYVHHEIEQKILIIDQSCLDTKHELLKTYYNGKSGDIDITSTLPLYSGYGIDCAMRVDNLQTDYICQIHCDAFPIHPNWLYLPIKLIEENNFSFVGQLQFINAKENLASIYPPNPFFAMAQCFNVAKTETYKEMSLEAGFTRFHNRPKSELTFKSKDWYNWAHGAFYGQRGSDDDVVAFHWEDVNREHDKLGLAITGMIAAPYGRIIEDIVFHFGSARESVGVIGQMSQQYQDFTKRINENYSDELISEMVSLARAKSVPGVQILSRNFWNGKTKESSPPTDELNKRIEELKNGT